jgi:hypothetical protein
MHENKFLMKNATTNLIVKVITLLSRIAAFIIKVAYLLDSPILSLFDNLMHMLFF